MRKLGEIVVKTRDKLLIVKSQVRDPRRLVGAVVYDSTLRRIGRIVDVIGKTDQPYVVVKPENREIVDFVEPGPAYYYVERRKSPRQVKGKRKKRGKKPGRRGRGSKKRS